MKTAEKFKYLTAGMFLASLYNAGSHDGSRTLYIPPPLFFGLFYLVAMSAEALLARAEQNKEMEEKG